MAFRLTAGDKKVIDAFTDKKRADSKKLSTDGKSLKIRGFGGGTCCYWKGGKITCPDPDSRAMQTVQRAVKKMAPPNMLEGVLDDETREDLQEAADNLEEAQDPIAFNTQLAKLLKRLKKDLGATKVRQGYKGTGTKKHRRQIWVDGAPGGNLDLWLETGRIKMGGVMRTGAGQISYDDKTPEEVYREVVRWFKGQKEHEENPMGEIFTESQRDELTQLAERMSDEARELKLYVDNDGQLYRQQTTSIIKNLMRKRAAGKYDSKLAVKLVMYLMDAGAKKYAKEHGSPGVKWNDMFPKRDRMMAAEDWVDDFESEAEEGNYDEYIPKKYRK